MREGATPPHARALGRPSCPSEGVLWGLGPTGRLCKVQRLLLTSGAPRIPGPVSGAPQRTEKTSGNVTRNQPTQAPGLSDSWMTWPRPWGWGLPASGPARLSLDPSLDPSLTVALALRKCGDFLLDAGAASPQTRARRRTQLLQTEAALRAPRYPPTSSEPLSTLRPPAPQGQPFCVYCCSVLLRLQKL